MAMFLRPARLLRLSLLIAVAAASAAATARQRPPLPWQKVIRDDDRKRLSGLYRAWTRSLAEMRDGGQVAAAAAMNPPVPGTAIAGAFPGPGTYRCRTVKLGSRSGGAALQESEFTPCAVRADGGGLRFEQSSGRRRIAGRLYPDGDRMVFLGAMALAQEMGVMAYGDDRDRDQVGVLRRIAEGRWRLELPWPKWESTLDLIEIVAPAADDLPLLPPSARPPAS